MRKRRMGSWLLGEMWADLRRATLGDALEALACAALLWAFLFVACAWAVV